MLEHDLAGPEDAPVAVLLHSGIADRRSWEPQWAPLSERLRVVRADLRGYGETPLPPGPYSNARDVLALLDHLGLERAALVGCSFGGRVALEATALAPDRVTRLALLCAGMREWEWSEEVRASWEQEEALWDAGDLDGVADLNVRTWVQPEVSDDLRELVRDGQRRAVEVQLAAESSEPPPGPDEAVPLDLGSLTMPALVVAGLRDFPDFVGIARTLADGLPNARLVELDTGHLPALERPREATELLLGFLTES